MTELSTQTDAISSVPAHIAVLNGGRDFVVGGQVHLFRAETILVDLSVCWGSVDIHSRGNTNALRLDSVTKTTHWSHFDDGSVRNVSVS